MTSHLIHVLVLTISVGSGLCAASATSPVAIRSATAGVATSASVAHTPKARLIAAITTMRQLTETEEGCVTIVRQHLSQRILGLIHADQLRRMAARPADAKGVLDAEVIGKAIFAKGTKRFAAMLDLSLGHIAEPEITVNADQTKFNFVYRDDTIQYVLEDGSWRIDFK